MKDKPNEDNPVDTTVQPETQDEATVSPYTPEDEDPLEVSDPSLSPSADQVEAEPPPEPAAEEQIPEPTSEPSVEGMPEPEPDSEAWVDGYPPADAVEPPEPPAVAPPPTAPPPGTPEAEGDSDDEFEAEKELGARMTFLEHLDELRKRLLYSILAIGIAFGGAWGFREYIFNFIRRPIDQVVDELIITSATDPFTIYMKVAFVVGIFIASPVILFQVWQFIAPGLYRKEKRYVLPFLFSSTILFLSGGAFAYYILLPPALNFLILELGRQFKPFMTAMDYFDLVILFILGMGALFQLPVLIAFLSMFGLISPGFLWRNFRYAFLLIVIAAAIISQNTDPFSLMLWTGPLVVLYLIGIIVSWVFKRRRLKRERLESEA